MIGQVFIGKSFGGVVRYVLDKDQAEVLDESGVRSSNAILATQDFNAIRIQKPNVKNAVWHTSISFAYDDKLSEEKMMSIGKDYLQKIGLNDHQYLMVRHHDTRHNHIHIISNRIGFDGKLISDKWCKNRTSKICDILEEKYGLTIARKQGKKNQKANDKVPIKKQIKSEVRTAIAASLAQGTSTFEQLFKDLKLKGIKGSFHSQKTGRINGISFRHRNINLKGSSINRSFSFGKLAKRLSQNRSHDNDQDNDQRRKN